MKLVRFDTGDGAVRLGVVRGDAVVTLTDIAMDYLSVRSIIEGGLGALAKIRDFVAVSPDTVLLKDVRLLAPIERPGKYLAIGMNYQKHLEEAARIGVVAPKQQLWFNKQTSCISGPHDDIDPGVTDKLDYEVELGVVIGMPAKNVKEADARAHVFGYFVANDVSARDWQFHSPTFTVGKSFDTHGPIGPWIVTADEVPDPHALKLRCSVNGETRQQSDTSQMIFNIWQQIAYLSTAFTLESGDLLATGTPEGVGVGMRPPQFLQPGDVVRCEIEGIGVIENHVRRPTLSSARITSTLHNALMAEHARVDQMFRAGDI
jgi:2-keto-4-pentenoate hydratase/2-oxohepta-3-ene-1,7-dioic acid hydratase in catechol pathway